jgi:hypothetical protein
MTSQLLTRDFLFLSSSSPSPLVRGDDSRNASPFVGGQGGLLDFDFDFFPVPVHQCTSTISLDFLSPITFFNFLDSLHIMYVYSDVALQH